MAKTILMLGLVMLASACAQRTPPPVPAPTAAPPYAPPADDPPAPVQLPARPSGIGEPCEGGQGPTAPVRLSVFTSFPSDRDVELL